MIKLNPYIFKGVYRKSKSANNNYVINDVEYFVLCEKDFYPPKDDREWCSGVEDSYDYKFCNYCEDIFEALDEEGYWD